MVTSEEIVARSGCWTSFCSSKCRRSPKHDTLCAREGTFGTAAARLSISLKRAAAAIVIGAAAEGSKNINPAMALI